mmetsp:Transcript_35366/g.81582  ORF Transcript_35366/g.81582 Transcript_35366/m.81582 type:complete len:207 (-) Transcript_35366:257-877(-)
MSILQPNQQALALGGAAHDLDVANQRIQIPLPLQNTLEGVKLQFAFLTEDDVVSGDHKQGAHKLLLDFLDVLVVHIKGIFMRDLIDEHLVWQLYSQSVTVNSNFLDVVLTSDANFLLRHQVLDNDICHHVSVCISILVQTVHCGENNLVHHDAAIVAANDYIILPRSDRSRPNPVVPLAQVTQVDALPAPELDLLPAASQHKVIST